MSRQPDYPLIVRMLRHLREHSGCDMDLIFLESSIEDQADLLEELITPPKDEWTYLTSVEALNALIAGREIERLECKVMSQSRWHHTAHDIARSSLDFSRHTYRCKLKQPSDGWIYPSALDVLNAALDAGDKIQLQFRERTIPVDDDAWLGASSSYRRSDTDWRRKEYRYKLKGEAMELKAAYAAMQAASGIKVGDKVKVLRRAKSNELGWQNSWNETMTRHVGSEGEVLSINGNGIELRIEGAKMDYNFPFFVLERIPKPVVRLGNVAGHETHVLPGEYVKVGCTTVSAVDVERIIEAWKK